jgi:hypothetical protein
MMHTTNLCALLCALFVSAGSKLTIAALNLKTRSSNQGATKSHDHLFKFVVVGAPKVGKTALINRFTKGEFDDIYLPTSEMDSNFQLKENFIVDGERLKLEIWETGILANRDQYRGIESGKGGIVLVFDIEDGQRFCSVTTTDGFGLICLTNRKKCSIIAVFFHTL